MTETQVTPITYDTDSQPTESRGTIDTLLNHVSIRRYLPDPIPADVLNTVLAAARRSPTSSNMQAYSFVVVTDAARKARLAELAGNQSYIADCPVFIAVCADTYRLERAAEMHDRSLARNLENTLVASVDAALAGMSLATAAESVGLGSVMIGGMRNHPAEVAELLNFPPGVYVVYGMCLGYPNAEQVPPQKPRLAAGLVVHHEQYDRRHIEADLATHDAELAAHYRSQGRTTPDAAWTGVIADKFSQPKRPDLRHTLEAMGFSFE